MADCRDCANDSAAPGISRRTFLARATAGLGALIALALGSSGLTYFLSPAFKKEEEDWIDIGPVDNLRPDQPVKIDYVGRKRDAWSVTEKRSSTWVLARKGKEIVAFDPRCTHLGCPYRWDDQKKQFLCPCHAGIFDINGRVVSGPPPRGLDRYLAKVVAGRLLIKPQASSSSA